ncbi:double-strand break repair protein AddB [Ancylobacter terrae]|uniref:double-strand break repair protein AddB n=1 Tax=Ancylobacter sp. sgz301288 TaxID=3342077 RepID=UPI00385C7868
MLPSRGPRLFTIPASAPFLPALAQALLDGRLVEGFAPRGDPLALARATVYLPTRRAGRLFGEALLAAAPGGATLLPRIVPLGDVDEDANAFAENLPDPPVPVPGMTRRLALARLVGAWRRALVAGDARADVAAGAGSELALADALAGLIDEMAVQRVDWTRLDDLVPGEHDRYWDMALDFLKIARHAWPAFLEENGYGEASERQARLAEAEAKRLESLGAAAGPVVAAGSTGSMPATLHLLRAIARLPRGAVVLPGLDPRLADAERIELVAGAEPAPSHPQYGLARLMIRLGATRDQVVELVPPAPHGREALLGEALRPVATTDAWADLSRRLPPPALDAALAGLTLVEADDTREEALVIAFALREVLDRPGATGALITPDRDLARRVAAELLRFGVAIDDSAGEPLADTPAGRFARLVADAAAGALAPRPLAGLLRHPLARFGLSREELQAAADALELLVLRGPRPAPGAAGLAAAVAGFSAEGRHRTDPRLRLDAAAIAQASDLAARIGAALGPLLALGEGEPPFAALVAAHRAALAAAGEIAGASGEGELADVFERMAEASEHAAPMTLADYAAALPLLLGDAVVRPPAGEGARIRILGPLEARLTAFDRVILGCLVEDVWPGAGRSDPWLSRPMRASLGLEAPERRIGLAAHDFVQACGAPELILSRPAKLAGAPTVPSRFQQRLEAVSGAERWALARARGDVVRRRAARLDTDPPGRRAARPMPTPKLELRPTRLSVTEIETFLRDPYSIYARHVLKLNPLDALDETPGGAERGTAIHEALGAFAGAFPEALPADALARLLAFGRAAFRDLEAFPAEHAVWWARFERLAGWYVAWERERRPELAALVVETGGRLDIPLPAPRGAFVLTARADRIERRRADGRLVIVDFKTGTVPSAKQVAQFSPQLPLEAAIAAAGGFRDVPAGPAADLVHVKLGGGSPPLEEKGALAPGWTAESLAAATLERLAGLVRAFENERQPYVALKRPMFAGRFGDYDHLARVGEWSVGEGEEGEA